MDRLLSKGVEEVIERPREKKKKRIDPGNASGMRAWLKQLRAQGETRDGGAEEIRTAADQGAGKAEGMRFLSLRRGCRNVCELASHEVGMC